MLIFIIAVSGVLLFGILYSNLKVRSSYIKRGEDNDIVIDWTGLYGILKYTKKISAMDIVKTDGNIPTGKSALRQEIRIMNRLTMINPYIMYMK